MSEENPEIVRRFIESIGDGDYESAGRQLDPNGEWHNTMKVEEIVDGGEIIVVKVHGWGRGAGSGVPIDVRWAHVMRLRGAKVLRVDTYGRFERALEAAGLQE